MNNFLLWIAGLFALCLAALFAAPHFIDWNGYRGVFEKEASRVLGRRVRVGGEVNLRVLPVPYVSFDKLSIADVDSTSGAPFIRVDNFKMWLAVPPMLQGVLEAYRIELHRPVVELVGNSTGGGNWQSFEIRPGALPFVPGDVTLGEMDLVDGQIVYRNSAGDELTRIEAISGELSAAAISGPYKFSGNFTWLGGRNDLRFSTARASGEGGPVRFKASIKSLTSGSSYVVDGAIDGRDGKTTLSGELTARLNGLMALTEAGGDKDTSKASTASTGNDNLLDLRAKIDGDVQSVSLKDIALALQSEGPPQLMHGTGKISWRDETALTVNLDSRWIDFDRFVPASQPEEKVTPFDHARRMLIALGRALPENTVTNFGVSLDQATLGGEALGSIQLVAERRDGPLKLREFEARVPGGGKVAVSGSLAVSKSDPGFNGQIAAEGRSLLRFLRWGLDDPELAEGLTDGPFDLQSDLKLDSDTVRLSKATIDFGATPLAGALDLDLGSKRRVALTLEGHTIDWSRLWPGSFDVGVVRALTRGTADKVEEADGTPTTRVTSDEKAEPRSSPSWLAGDGPTNVQVNLKATKLIDGDRTFRDFEGQVRSDAGRLSVPVLKFSMESGLGVDLKAEGTTAAETGSGGNIKGLIEANSRLAVLDLLHVLDASEFDPYLRPRLTALAPLRVATTVNLAGVGSKQTDMTFDGLSRGGRFVARLRLEDGLANWRQAPADFSVMVENDQDHRLLSLLSSSRQFSTASPASSTPGRLVIKAAGRPQKGMLTRAALERDGLNMQYYGTVAVPAGESVALDGHIECEADNLRQAFALLGLDVAGAASAASLSGEMELVRTDKTLRLQAEDLKISSSKVSGLITLTQQTNAPSKLVVDLKSSSATLPGLLSVFLAEEHKASAVSAALSEAERDIKGVTAEVKDVATVETSEVWPGTPFDLSPLLNVEGYITADFEEFALEPGLSMGPTRLEATVSPGKLSVTSLVGTALGGKANAAFELEKAAAGVTLKGDVAIKVGEAPSKTPTSSGKETTAKPDATVEAASVQTENAEPTPAIAFNLSYAGRALSPQALVSDLDGKGQIVLADASLTGLTAKEVRTVAGEILGQQGIIETTVLVKDLQDKIKQGEIKLGAITVPVDLQDGALKVAPIEIESADGKTKFKADLALSSMKFSSEWKVTAASPEVSKPSDGENSPRPYLPPVSVLYLGQLNKLGDLTPRIGTGALERELAVRKMERDVSELERLRKLDEARAKEEEDRRRELERSLREQRAKAEERERLLKQQQEQGLIGPDGELLMPPTGDELPNAEAEDSIQSPPRGARPKRRPKPPQNVWKPFQITPY